MERGSIGRGWLMPTESSIVATNNLGQIASLTSERSEIKQSILIILTTIPGERVMRPDFGCRIHELVFAPNNRQTAVQAERYITQALQRWEPRIVLNTVMAQPANRLTTEVEGASNDRRQALESALLITIRYTLRATGSEETVSYPYYLMSGNSASVL